VRELGRGGFGSVFLAERADGGFQQRVALKLIHRGAAQGELRQRFLRERQILASLSHPNIATLLDGGIAPDGRPFFALEYVEGEPIHTYCHARRLTLDERLRLLLEVCDAVEAAHGKRIVHRDLKPSNVLVDGEGRVKLLDFGIAKLLDDAEAAAARTQLTRTGMRLLTPEYAAPEQLAGEEVTPATDVYALGVLLAELLTGRRPAGHSGPAREGGPATPATPSGPLAVTAETAAALGMTTGELRRRLRGDLAVIVQTALREEPARRYRSAGALAADLRAYLRGEPIAARPDSLVYRGAKLWRRRRATVVAAALALVTLALAAVVWWSERARANRESAVPRAFHLVSTRPGLHRAGAFSPDGKRVVYVDFTRGVPQLWVQDLASGAARQLTHDAVAASRPRWSPRGDVIVYGAFLPVGNHRQWIYAISPDGGEPRPLVEDGTSPSFSRDGKRLVFERGSGKIVVADADGSNARELAGVPESQWVLFTDMSPTFSPDGTQIAFFRCENGPNGDVWVMSSAGGGARQLTHDFRQGGTPAWSSDGRFVFWSSLRSGSRTIWRIPAAGGTPEPVTTGSGEDTDLALDAGGRRLLYTTSQTSENLVVQDPVNGAERVVLQRRGSINFPEASPDGSRFAFFGSTETGFSLFTVGRDGGDPFQVTRGAPLYDIFPHWSGDGRSLYFFEYQPTRSFRRVPATGGASVEVQAGWDLFTNARVDPADRRVVYDVGEPWHPRRTLIRNLATGAERALPTPILGMRWSRDGSRIVAYTFPREVVVCSATAGDCRVLATKAHSPVWGPGEREVYFLRGPERLEDPTVGRVHVFAVGVDGKNERAVATLEPIIVFNKSLDVTPQGELLWSRYQRTSSQLWMADLP
jgi:Tol biopolymer transport system component